MNIFWGGSGWLPGTVVELSGSQPDILIVQSNLTEQPLIGIDLATLDVNGDGIDDLAVGARHAQNSLGLEAGAVYVLYGSDNFPAPLVIDIAQDQQDLTIEGKWGTDYFGRSITAGDVNGDQVDDLVVGAGRAWRDGARYGAMYAFFGSDTFPPHHLIELQQTEADVTVVGTRDLGFFGLRVTCGDFNGDGLDDLCGSEDRYGTVEGWTGAVYMLHGRDEFPAGSSIDLRSDSADVTFYGDDIEYSFLGYALSAGDMDGDGIDELNISAQHAADSSEEHSGAHNIFIGTGGFPPYGIVDLADIYPTLRIMGEEENDATEIFSDLTDIDGDGIDDIIIGHAGADRPEGEDCGEIYIFYSRGLPIDRPPRILAGPGPDSMNPPELRLWDPFYNAAGWSSRYTPFLTQGYGVHPAAGDLDGDGYDEILVGPGPGPDHPPLVLALDPTGNVLWQFQAYGAPRYGVNLAAGDLNGDGRDEIVTGAGPGEVYGPHVRGWMLSDDRIVSMGA